MIVLDYRDSRPLYQQVKGSLRRIAELTGRLVPLLEELKSLGYTREQLLVLWEGGEGK